MSYVFSNRDVSYTVFVLKRTSNKNPFTYRRSTADVLWVLSSLSEMVEESVLPPSRPLSCEQPHHIQGCYRLQGDTPGVQNICCHQSPRGSRTATQPPCCQCPRTSPTADRESFPGANPQQGPGGLQSL